MVPKSSPSSSLVDTDWSAVESIGRRYWADAFDRTGFETALRASTSLWQHMRRIRPDWPSAADRKADLEHHVSIKRLLDRAAGVATR